ncbi:MAG: DUF58 domain-containing protein [Phycisphaerae bacterium]|nr:DUF58 domain-containing protein [Phycisphaerae bacterium]
MASPASYLDPQVIQQVSRLDLRARFIVEGFLAGLHRSPFQGLSVEFAEHRKYTAGDDLRTIDWNVFARTDRLYVRQYQAETHLDCHLLVDASASMGYVGPLDGELPVGGRSSAKLAYAIHLAAALGYLIIHQQDAVGLGVLADGLAQLLPARSRRQHLFEILATLSAVEPHGGSAAEHDPRDAGGMGRGLTAGIHQAVARWSHRGLVVLLSDLLAPPAELLEALHHIRFRGHDLIVMHILDQAEVRFPFVGGLELEDPESRQPLRTEADSVRRAYLDELTRWRDMLRTQLAAAHCDYLALDTAMPFDRALVEFLVQRSRRR